MSSVEPEDSGLDASTYLAHVQMLIAEVTRGDPGAAHARYSVAMSLLSYAEKPAAGEERGPSLPAGIYGRVRLRSHWKPPSAVSSTQRYWPGLRM